MIDNALRFVVSELNKYIGHKQQPQQDPSVNKLVMLANVVKAQDENPPASVAGPVLVTLVNVEEDRMTKSPLNYTKVYDKVHYKNPTVFLNLYVLFTSVHRTYETSLQYLSLVIQFFQYKNVLNNQNSPGTAEAKLDPKIDQLIFDMVTMNFEQINHLWATLGGKYLPSVLYKVRLVPIEDETPQVEGVPISEITINDGQKATT